MKKAEEYFNNFCLPSNEDLRRVEYDVCMLIQQAQIDAIEETVKKCAENVTHTAGQWYSDYSCMKWKVEKVADQLKKELE